MGQHFTAKPAGVKPKKGQGERIYALGNAGIGGVERPGAQEALDSHQWQCATSGTAIIPIQFFCVSGRAWLDQSPGPRPLRPGWRFVPVLCADALPPIAPWKPKRNWRQRICAKY